METAKVKHICILIDNVTVEEVKAIKFFGVMIDNNIYWRPHIKHIQTKIFRSVAILSKAKYFPNYAAHVTLQYSVLRTNITLLELLCRNMEQQL